MTTRTKGVYINSKKEEGSTRRGGLYLDYVATPSSKDPFSSRKRDKKKMRRVWGSKGESFYF